MSPLLTRAPLTVGEFFKDRSDWLRVLVAPNERFGGWDVVIRVDGSYSDHETAVAVAKAMRREMEQLPDFPADRETWRLGL